MTIFIWSSFAYWYKNYHLLIKKKVSWKFSATSHGKGVVDGVGGEE